MGGITYVDTKLDFIGKVLYTETHHQRAASDLMVSIVDRFEYDDNDNMKAQYQQTGNHPEERLVAWEYNELGQLVKKHVGGTASRLGALEATALQTLDFEYNIRGWPTKVNATEALGAKDLMAYSLYYYTYEGSRPYSSDKKYDGSINQMVWKTQLDTTKRAYNFRYDDRNQMTEAYFHDLVSRTDLAPYKLNLSFSSTGNITNLKRNDRQGIAIDNLSLGITGMQLNNPYAWIRGNQVSQINDNADKEKGFIDGNLTFTDYEYDQNGNMVIDHNKGMTFSYNHVNLIDQVTFGDGTSLKYTYNASGQKLSKTYIQNGNSTTTDYLGGFQYRNGQLQFFHTPEGYFEVNEDPAGLLASSSLVTGATTAASSALTGTYVYQFKDHLGNIRLSYSDRDGDGVVDITRGGMDIDGDGDYHNEILQAQDYDALGYELEYEPDHPNSLINGIAEHQYKLQGKEYQPEGDLALYDFGSRMYDPTIGRWWSTDPQNQFASPYLAMGNNWPNAVDPDGEFVVPIIIGAVIGGFTGGVQADMSGGNFLDGVWKGALTGALGGAAGQIVSGGSFAASIASGGLSGGVTGSAGAILNGNNVFEGFYKGAAFGASIAAVSSSIEGFKNLKDYGRFGTNDGTLKYLFKDAQIAYKNYMDGDLLNLELETLAINKAERTLDFFTKRYGGIGMSIELSGENTTSEFGIIEISGAEFNANSTVNTLKQAMIHEQAHYYKDLIIDPKTNLGIGWRSDKSKFAKVFDYDGPIGYGETVKNSGKFRIPKSSFLNNKVHPYGPKS